MAFIFFTYLSVIVLFRLTRNKNFENIWYILIFMTCTQTINKWDMFLTENIKSFDLYTKFTFYSTVHVYPKTQRLNISHLTDKITKSLVSYIDTKSNSGPSGALGFLFVWTPPPLSFPRRSGCLRNSWYFLSKTKGSASNIVFHYMQNHNMVLWENFEQWQRTKSFVAISQVPKNNTW